jgi:hypothetical protein
VGFPQQVPPGIGGEDRSPPTRCRASQGVLRDPAFENHWSLGECLLLEHAVGSELRYPCSHGPQRTETMA